MSAVLTITEIEHILSLYAASYGAMPQGLTISRRSYSCLRDQAAERAGTHWLSCITVLGVILDSADFVADNIFSFEPDRFFEYLHDYSIGKIHEITREWALGYGGISRKEPNEIWIKAHRAYLERCFAIEPLHELNPRGDEV